MAGSNLAIREARSADVDALVALGERTIRACYPSFLGEASVAAFVDGSGAASYLRDLNKGALVACLDGKVVGLAACRNNLIDLLMIDVACQRAGLGTSLLARCEVLLFRDFERLELESFAGNEPANRFYAKNGWLEAGRFQDDAAGVEKIRMFKNRPR